MYHVLMSKSTVITLDQSKRGGQPTIRGMRITVYDILKLFASGMTMEEVLQDFPELTPEDIRAVFAYASDREGETIFAARHEVTA